MPETRRLAAIMFTDMVGYTAAVQRDEAGTLELLREQERLVRPLFASHQGREIKSTGDGFLAEFDSALLAVRCALEIQERLEQRNALGGTEPIRLRIGIHLGDVEVRGSDIFGDAVNVAARIQPLAEPGGICITGPVYGEVRNKIPNRIDRLGPQTLKGVRLATDVYRVAAAAPAAPGPAVAGGPVRIAVLPFANISPDPNDGYLGDGLTEELITVLSQIQGLRVIARTSVNSFKSVQRSIAQIGAELGVGFVVEGSVRKEGKKLRITVQLIEVSTEEHTWSSIYDRQLDDLFAVQADISKQVADALRVQMGTGGQERLDRPQRVGGESYESYLRGRALLAVRGRTEADQAIAAFERAISLDPNNAPAYSGLADARLQRREVADSWEVARRDGGESRRENEECAALIAKALALDPDLAEAHASSGYLLLKRSRYRDAAEELRRALALNPSYSVARSWYADLLYVDGRSEEALRQIVLAEEADPATAASRVNLLMGIIGIVPRDSGARAYEGIYYAVTGRGDKAREIAAELEASDALGESKAYLLGVLYAYLDDRGRALQWLEEALRTRETNPVWWREAPGLESLRADPRFQELLKRLEAS